MHRPIVVAATGILLAACASTLPMSPASVDAEGKQFLSPPPGRAAVYVYSTRRNGGNDMTIGQRMLGILDDESWLRVDVPAGRQDLKCRLIVLKDAGYVLPLTLAAGQTVFVAATTHPLLSPSCHLAVVPADVGRAQVLTKSRILETSGASD